MYSRRYDCLFRLSLSTYEVHPAHLHHRETGAANAVDCSQQILVVNRVGDPLVRPTSNRYPARPVAEH